MSNEAITYALHREAGTSSKKLVLLVMANACNVFGEAYPSYAYLEQVTELNRKTIIAAIQQLVADGLLRDTGRRMGSTGQVIVYELPEFKNSPVFGTVSNAGKQSQKQRLTVPKTGHGNIRKPNKEKNTKKDIPGFFIEPGGGIMVHALPEWLPRESWQAWNSHRIETGRPMTQTAAVRTMAKLTKFYNEGHDPVQIIDLAIERGWQGIYATEQTKTKTPQTSDKGIPVLSEYDRNPML
jgi:hypothetical protein